MRGRARRRRERPAIAQPQAARTETDRLHELLRVPGALEALHGSGWCDECLLQTAAWPTTEAKLARLAALGLGGAR